MKIQGLTSEDDLSGTCSTSLQGYLPAMDRESFEKFAKVCGAEIEEWTENDGGYDIEATFKAGDDAIFTIYNRWDQFRFGSSQENKEKVGGILRKEGFEVEYLQ
tara:strand:- start:276 stop:587 length:312 start_codon:yes stop_codon:yes gene_type:complete